MSTSRSVPHTINQEIDKLPAPIAEHVPHLPETKEDLKQDVKVAASSGLSQLRALVAGGFGGVCAVVVGHPFDLVKVRLQTADRGVYSSAMDVVRKSVARDGLRRGLYAGVSAPLVGVTPMCKWSIPSRPSRMRNSPPPSRRLLLGLRPRQANRPWCVYRRPQWPFHRPDLCRRFLLCHPHDGHHGAL